MNAITVYWREPLMFAALIIPVLLISWGLYRQRSRIRTIASRKLLPWVAVTHNPPKYNTVRYLLAISWIFFCIALAGPRTVQWLPPSLHTNDASVIIIIDFSASMYARDNRFDRLSRAQLLVQTWMETIKPSIEVGLIVFAGNTHTLLEPTTDHKLFKHFVDQLTHTHLPTLGNNIADALELAAKQLQQRTGEKRILVLSDGDWGRVPERSAQSIASTLHSKLDIELYTVGLGGDEAITVPGFDAEPLVIRGKAIVSRLHESSLKQLARDHYQHISSISDQSLEQLLKIPKQRIDPDNADKVLWREWFTLPLVPGVFLLLLALEIESRRRTQ